MPFPLQRRFVPLSAAFALSASPAFAIPPPGPVAPPPAAAATSVPGGGAPLSGAASSGELLKQIGRVRAITPRCSEIAARADAGAQGIIDGYASIGAIQHTLTTGDFDSNEFAKYRELKAISIENAKLAERAEEAGRAVRLLRDDAASATDPDERADLLAFANALDGALHRMGGIARNVASFVAIVNVRRAVTPMDRDEMEIGMSSVSHYDAPGGRMIDDPIPPLLSTIAKDASGEIDDRATGITRDVEAAAAHFDGAMKSCE